MGNIKTAGLVKTRVRGVRQGNVPDKGWDARALPEAQNTNF
jgi:hypothetical protein